jgi:signal transduction histidine kinase
MTEGKAVRKRRDADRRSPADERLRQLLRGLKAVRDGDFSIRLPQVDDVLMDEMADVFNGMVDQFALLTSEVTRVTREVVTGDLTRSISVEARGEMAELKDNINAMAHSLRETTRANQDQDWLNTNLAKFSGLTRGHRELRTVGELIMNELTPLVGAQYSTFYLAEDGAGLRLVASYGHRHSALPEQFRLGESLVGQAAHSKRAIVVDQTPPDYVRIASSLGSAGPVSLIVLPIVFEDQALGVIELASFDRFTPVQRDFLEQLMETIGVTVNTIIANARTDSLLAESRRLTRELQARSGELQEQRAELRRSNAELAEKAELLATQNRDIEVKNFEIEQARQEIEQRAQRLALASKYKSEFLVNMSHELRTPLNSLLILARLLAQNTSRNLTPKQVEFANVIHSAGTDLLQLIDDILDLSTVEAGRMDAHPERFPLRQPLDYVRTTFQPLTVEKGLGFGVRIADTVPDELFTDEPRLRQVLRNLLSNAVKFTESGRVDLEVRRERRSLVFTVSDTGIGIAPDNLDTIFGAFQQADGTTNRRYGGTGLGLSISREFAALLGGEINAESELGVGSTFTLRLPIEHFPPADTPRSEESDELGGRKVLVVDDDDRNVFAIVGMLETYGVTVLNAPNGREGIELLLANADVDLILMHVMMPEMDGYATTEAIRQMPRFADLPIIAMTAKAMPGDREKSLASGTNDYVTEPVDVDELLDRVRRWLGA